MKKIMLLVLAVLMCVPVVSSAATIDGAETLGRNKFEATAGGEYIFERKLDVNSYTRDFSINLTGEIFNLNEQTEADKPKVKNMYRTGGKFSYGILDVLDIFAIVGTSSGTIKEDYSGTAIASGSVPTTSCNISNGSLKHELDNSVYYGGGLKAAYEFKDGWINGWILGCNIQYIRQDNDYTATDSYVLDVPGVGLANVNTRYKGTLTTQEWQAAPYIGKKLGMFTPYLGVAYSDVRIKDKPKSNFELLSSSGIFSGDLTSGATQSYKTTYKSNSVVGPFIGLDYKIGNRWRLNIEGRFVSETAVSATGSFKF